MLKPFQQPSFCFLPSLGALAQPSVTTFDPGSKVFRLDGGGPGLSRRFSVASFTSREGRWQILKERVSS